MLHPAITLNANETVFRCILEPGNYQMLGRVYCHQTHASYPMDHLQLRQELLTRDSH